MRSHGSSDALMDSVMFAVSETVEESFKANLIKRCYQLKSLTTFENSSLALENSLSLSHTYFSDLQLSFDREVASPFLNKKRVNQLVRKKKTY